MVPVTPANATGPVPVLVMFGQANLPAPAQPNQDELKIINDAFKKLLSEENPAVKAIFDKYLAYTPITRATTSSFRAIGPQTNPNADPPSTQHNSFLLQAGVML